MKRLAIATLVVLAIAWAISAAQHKDDVISKADNLLTQSKELFQAQQFEQAGRVDLQVLKIEELPKKELSEAVLLMGNIELASGFFNSAEIAYEHVLEIKIESTDDKDTTTTLENDQRASVYGLLAIDQLRKQKSQFHRSLPH